MAAWQGQQDPRFPLPGHASAFGTAGVRCGPRPFCPGVIVSAPHPHPLFGMGIPKVSILRWVPGPRGPDPLLPDPRRATGRQHGGRICPACGRWMQRWGC